MVITNRQIFRRLADRIVIPVDGESFVYAEGVQNTDVTGLSGIILSLAGG
jgi:hypothetical protein